jgi:hypothetical protein
MVLEHLILRMLRDKSAADFADLPAFRASIQDSPEAAGVLVGLLRDLPEPLVDRAHLMLSECGAAALPQIAAGLSSGTAVYRSALLSIAWTIVAALDPKYRSAFLSTFMEPVRGLFGEKEIVDPAPGNLGPVEIEYEYRLCDEGYLLLRYLSGKAYDEDDFRALTFEERDREIATMGGRTLVA